MLVRDVDLPSVMSVLEPIWREKTKTASRLRGRIELVLDWAAAHGYRSKDNPARWRGHLDKLLAAPDDGGLGRLPGATRSSGPRGAHRREDACQHCRLNCSA